MIWSTKKFKKETNLLKGFALHLRSQTTNGTGSASGSDLSPDRKQALKQQLLLAVAKTPQQEPQTFWYTKQTFIFRYASIALVVVFLLTGTAYASAVSKPGDILFPVKKASEAIQVKFAGSEAKKVELEARFAEKRIEELKQIELQVFSAPTSTPKSTKSKKEETRIKAQAEVNKALNTLENVKVQQQTKGNTTTVESIDKTLTRLKEKLDDGRKGNSGKKNRNDNEDKNNNEKSRTPSAKGDFQINTKLLEKNRQNRTRD